MSAPAQRVQRGRPPLPPLPVEVVRLGWISLFTDVASEMATPLIPLYLASLLSSPGLALGWVEGSAQALLAGMTAVSGWHSDRLRRRVPYVRLGYGLALVAKTALAFALHWVAVLGLRLLDRVGKGIRTAPRDALLSELAEGRKGAAFGLHRGMDSTGALVGALLAALLLAALPGSYRLVFALTALPGLIAVVLTFTLHEPADLARPTREPATPLSPRQALRTLPGTFWLVAGVLWLFSLGTVSESFLLLRAHEQGFADPTAILSYALFNLAYALSSYPAGRMSDAWGRTRLLAAGWAVYVATMTAALALRGAWIVWLFPLLGLHLGLTHGVGKAWLADHSPPHLRGTALGVFHLGAGLAMLAGAVVAGWLWDEVAPMATFGWGAGIGLVSLAALASLVRRGLRPCRPA